MNQTVIPAGLTNNSSYTVTELQAEPQSLEIVVEKTGMIIVDMQNGFVKKGGFFDLHGIDVSQTEAIIDPINRIADLMRANKCKVIYIATRYEPDFRETGGPATSAWHKVRVIEDYQTRSEWRDKLLVRGTWGAEIVEELTPKESDIIVEKPKYSAFFGTNLDMILKRFDLKYLIFTGTASNICVESSLRDSYYLGYFPVLVSDATSPCGPDYCHDTALFNVKFCFGWVTTLGNIEQAFHIR